MDEQSNLSWIGFTDLFLHLFIFFLAGFMLLKYFATNETIKAEEKLQQCQAEISEGKKHEELRTVFGKIISQALNTLVKLKKGMEESNLPIQIEQRPDRLFFDMGIAFPFNSKQIPSKQKQAIIDIGNTFREILNTSVAITPDGKHYYLYNIMRVVIEGHADYKKRDKNDQISNYIVSKERAFAVMELLVAKSGLLPPKYKISMAGFAEYGRQPKLTEEEKQDEEQIRRRMRRVTISIVPDYDEFELLMERAKK